MPVRRFNYTGRKRILHHQVAIVLHESGNDDAPTFTAELSLGNLDLPPDARLMIVSQRNRAAMRFPWGTVGNPTPPANCRLDETPDNPHFRVMALDESRRLLALADRVQPRRANRRESLLWLMEADLGREVWRLDFGMGDDMAVLRVNSRMPGLSETARNDPAFRALVAPQVLRSVLERALLVERERPDDAEGRWKAWFDLARDLMPEQEPPVVDYNAQEDQIARADRWIEDVVAAFARKKARALESYRRTKR